MDAFFCWMQLILPAPRRGQPFVISFQEQRDRIPSLSAADVRDTSLSPFLGCTDVIRASEELSKQRGSWEAVWKGCVNSLVLMSLHTTLRGLALGRVTIVPTRPQLCYLALNRTPVLVLMREHCYWTVFFTESQYAEQNPACGKFITRWLGTS